MRRCGESGLRDEGSASASTVELAVGYGMCEARRGKNGLGMASQPEMFGCKEIIVLRLGFGCSGVTAFAAAVSHSELRDPAVSHLAPHAGR